MSRFYVTGGQQRTGAKGEEEWFSYARALVCEVDSGAGTVREVASYVTPEEFKPDEERSSIVFKAASLHRGELVVCTQTEVLFYSLPDFQIVRRLDHPWFNDLHHVAPRDNGNWLIAVTGLDLVVEMAADGTVVREFPVLDGDPWTRFDRGTDYRKVLTTKPHHAHPNYVFEHGGHIWSTRLHQRDAVCLTDSGRTLDPMPEKVHDGVVDGDRVWFTTVDGHVVAAEPATGRLLAVHDLNAISSSDRTLGWCRGLHLLGDDRVVVGFSRIRPSRFKENVGWVKHRLGLREDAGRRPTRLACYDLARGVHEWDLELEEFGLNAVFSILPAG